jgi:hypothetical protein
MAKRTVIGDPICPKPAPLEFAGLWVAWNDDETAIVAQAKTLADVEKAAQDAGYPDAVLERVRRPDRVQFFEFASPDKESLLLGHAGFLDYFTATFDGQQSVLTLWANDNLPKGQ